MITRCIHCRVHIRDCTAFQPRYVDGLKISVPVTGWYHTATGHERCGGMDTIARPVPLVSVRCPMHPRRLIDGCLLCATAGDVSAFFHNEGRCIERLCYWHRQ